MLIVTIVINAIAMLSCGIAAGLNFKIGMTFSGVAMMLLFIMNAMFFAINLGRLF